MNSLSEWIKSKIDPKTGMIAANYAELVERIEAYAAEREREARIADWNNTVAHNCVINRVAEAKQALKTTKPITKEVQDNE